MTSASKLKEKLRQNEQARERAVDQYRDNEITLKENEQRAAALVGQIMEQERMMSLEQNELIKTRLDRLNDQQHFNNRQLKALNTTLSDMSDLEALYRTKREEMDRTHQERLKELVKREKTLKNKIKGLNQKYQTLHDEYEALSLKKETKRQTDKFMATLLVVFLAVVLGSWFGFGFVDTLRSIGQWFKGIFKRQT